MKKVITALFITLSLCILMIGSFMTVSASEITIQDMKDKLVSEGLPNSYLQRLTDSHIESLYKDSFEYDFSYTEETVYMNDDTEVEKDDSAIVPHGHIDESMFKMQISKNTYLSSNNRVSKVNIVVYYEWVKNPMNKRTDGITVNWDSSIFTFEAGSFYSYDKVLIHGVESKKLNESTVPDLAQQGGIGYSAVLGVHVDSSTPMGWARGTATFNILPTNPIYQSSSAEGGAVTSINVNYVHDKTPIFGSISFSYAGMGVTINAPIFNDNSSASLNFYYKK